MNIGAVSRAAPTDRDVPEQHIGGVAAATALKIAFARDLMVQNFHIDAG